MLVIALPSLPRLSVTPRSLIVRPSTSVAVTCGLQLDPGAALVTLSDVRWKHDGRELDTSRGHVTLIITDFDETTHSGVYQCSAELTGVGYVVSDHATLHAAGTPHVTSYLEISITRSNHTYYNKRSPKISPV